MWGVNVTGVDVTILNPRSIGDAGRLETQAGLLLQS